MNTGDERVEVGIEVPGAHMVRNALLAAAVGIDFGLSPTECADGLSQARLTGGRLARRMIRDTTILDDTYNANPDSMEAALRTLADMPCDGRRIAVLGRMGELGDHASAGYARVGRAAADAVDVLIVVGSECAPVTESARGGRVIAIHEVSSTTDAGALLRRIARPGDIVLVKGSRSARMEGVIQTFEI
jgi:UDP-N-acetylmuramoyl-tripeptide--D-alanyl-D-alanine ligase